MLAEVGKCEVIAEGRELSVCRNWLCPFAAGYGVNDLYVTEILQGVLDSDSAYLYIKTEFLELVLTDWCL